jgi:hypothetical protein
MTGYVVETPYGQRAHRQMSWRRADVNITAVAQSRSKLDTYLVDRGREASHSWNMRLFQVALILVAFVSACSNDALQHPIVHPARESRSSMPQTEQHGVDASQFV